jgi:16S rRNA (guanine(527)-N(7))-methyltransferase RsmG
MSINNRNKLSDYFKNSGFAITKYQIDQFITLFELLEEYNTEYDLSRIYGFNDILIKHFIDSIYFLNMIDLPDSLLDIGTGPGFPGFPISIIKPDIKIILAEPRYKRVKFLNLVKKRLNLKNIEIYPHLVTEKSFFNVNGVITRALESADETLGRVSHFLNDGSKVILLKGPGAEKDLSEISDKNKEEYILESNIPYTLPKTEYKRKIIVFKKIKSNIKKNYTIFKNSEETIGLPIISKENKQFKEFKKISIGDGIKKSGKIIISGKKIIKDLILKKSINPLKIIIYDNYTENDNYLNKLYDEYHKKNRLFILKKSLYNDIDFSNTSGPLLYTEIPELKDWDCKLKKGCNLIIPFQDPVNVGSVLRSAAGFNVKQIIMLKEAANPYHPKSIRTSSGAVFNTKILKGPSIKDLKKIIEENKLEFITLDSKGADINSFSFPENFLLFPGIEGPGVPEELKINSISIPLSDKIESLNASVATSLVLYKWSSEK